MSNPEYIIVGRDVRQARHHLVAGKFVEACKDPGGKPMDVVHIGTLIAQMSERECADRVASEDELDQIKHCLMVESVPPGQLCDKEKDAILQNTEIQVLFETREKEAKAAAEKNVRILVVPADGTIKATLDTLPIPGSGKVFEPPLTYPVDKDVMLNFLLDDIIAAAVNAPKPDNHEQLSWTIITKHIADHLEARLSQTNGVDQQSAFHRAVGIYATNMCR